VLEGYRRSVDPALPEAYAALSGDHNPIHLSDSSAQRVGLPRRVLHGMVTAAWCLDALEAASAESLKAFTCRFVQPAHPGDTLRFTPRRQPHAWTCEAVSESGAPLLKHVTATPCGDGRALDAHGLRARGQSLDVEPGMTARYAALLGLESAHASARMFEVVRVGPSVLLAAEQAGLEVAGAVHVALDLEAGLDPTPDRSLSVHVTVDDDTLRGGLRRVVVSARWGMHGASDFDTRGRWTLVSR